MELDCGVGPDEGSSGLRRILHKVPARGIDALPLLPCS
jgi:hypothetical protein